MTGSLPVFGTSNKRLVVVVSSIPTVIMEGTISLFELVNFIMKRKIRVGKKLP